MLIKSKVQLILTTKLKSFRATINYNYIQLVTGHAIVQIYLTWTKLKIKQSMQTIVANGAHKVAK